VTTGSTGRFQSVQCPQVYIKGLSQKNRVRGLPAPPPGGRCPLCPGFLSAERAIGPSGGWPLPPISPHAPGDTQGNVIRQPAGQGGGFRGGAAPAPTRGARGASSIRVPKKNAWCPGLWARCPKAEGLGGVDAKSTVPGRTRRRRKEKRRFTRAFFSFPRGLRARR
jgi:hypothetical protein